MLAGVRTYAASTPYVARVPTQRASGYRCFPAPPLLSPRKWQSLRQHDNIETDMWRVEDAMLFEVGKETEPKDVWNYAEGKHKFELNFPFEHTWKKAVPAGIVTSDT